MVKLDELIVLISRTLRSRSRDRSRAEQETGDSPEKKAAFPSGSVSTALLVTNRSPFSPQPKAGSRPSTTKTRSATQVPA